MKTDNKILELLKTLPEPYKTQATDNYDADYYNGVSVIKDVSDALNWAFEWISSKQGHEYWSTFYHGLISGNILPETTNIYEEMLEALKVAQDIIAKQNAVYPREYQQITAAIQKATPPVS